MSVSSKNNNVKKKHSKKKMEESSGENSGSSEEELDLTKECHPIAHYLSDRAEMINEMFSVIKGNKLKSMLPPILKDMGTEQLKLRCLDQLLGMSEKRITSILEGQVLTSSSESDVASEDSESDAESKNSRSERSSSSGRSKGRKRRKSDTESIGKRSKTSKHGEEKAAAPEPEGKTLLEILELEMRARAIRALLKGTDGQNSEANGTKDSTELASSGIVDLTEEDNEFPTVIKQEPTTEQELTFEEKIEKSKTKGQEEDAAKKKKLLAEHELRNKLINKKKSYRTRKQRMENVEDEDKEEPSVVVVKTEPVEENKEIVIEDPEEGEVSTEEEQEDEVIVVKQEKPESPPHLDEEPEKTIDGERIEAIDEGNFISNENLVYDEKAAEAIEEVVDEASQESEQGPEKENVISETEVPESTGEIEDTSWRDRWLKNDQVQKVVKSSKICGKVKKLIASRKKTEKAVTATPPDVENNDSNSNLAIVEGSVDEYRLLRGEEAVEQPNEILTKESDVEKGLPQSPEEQLAVDVPASVAQDNVPEEEMGAEGPG